jgi:hypothetical protein
MNYELADYAQKTHSGSSAKGGSSCGLTWGSGMKRERNNYFISISTMRKEKS